MHKAAKARLSGRGPVDKAIVQGAVQRGGVVRAEAVAETTALELQGNVRRWVDEGSAVYTDEAAAYLGLDQHFAHKSVNHSQEYVVGDVHTNTIENFWSLLKRAIKGTQIHVSEDHLDRYVIERAFAYNLRDRTDLARMSRAVEGTKDRRLTWRSLTDKVA